MHKGQSVGAAPFVNARERIRFGRESSVWSGSYADKLRGRRRHMSVSHPPHCGGLRLWAAVQNLKSQCKPATSELLRFWAGTERRVAHASGLRFRARVKRILFCCLSISAARRRAASSSKSAIGKRNQKKELGPKMYVPKDNLYRFQSNDMAEAEAAVIIGGIIARLEDPDGYVRADLLEALRAFDPATVAQHADAVLAMLEHSAASVREAGLTSLGYMDSATLAQHADAVLAKLEDSAEIVREAALNTLCLLETETLAQHADALLAKLEDCAESVRVQALITLGYMEPETLRQHADAVLAMLEDSAASVRVQALYTLGFMDPATLAQHADAVLARLDDSEEVRFSALHALSMLEPATLAQYANAVLARLEDDDGGVRFMAVCTLGEMEPATIAQHANAVLARLEDEVCNVREAALVALDRLKPATLAQYANAVLARLEDDAKKVRDGAMRTLRLLPGFVTRPGDFFDSRSVRSRFLGRLGWYKCRLRLRAQRLALYWYALPYRPSGPGHARDVEAWDRMTENQDHRVSITTAATRRKRCKAERNAGTQQNERQTRSRSRNAKNPRRE